MRRLLLAVLSLLLLVPGVAHAASVQLEADGGASQLSYDGTNAETNAVTIGGTPAAITIRDPGATVTIEAGSDAGCVLDADDHGVTCTLTAPARVNDVDVNLIGSPADAQQSITSTLTGFPDGIPFVFSPVDFNAQGPLAFTGGPTSESVSGGPLTGTGGGGNDFANLSEGTFAGGAGDDLALIASPTATFDGGPGQDAVATFGPFAFDGTTPQPLTARVDGAGTTTGNGYPGQNLTLTGVEGIYGGAGPDTLTGGSGPDLLVGLSGADTLDGGPGGDLLFGRRGPDVLSGFLDLEVGQGAEDGPSTIRAVDGAVDRIDCGAAVPGTTVAADAADALFGCPAPGAGTTLTPLQPLAPVVVQQPVLVRDTTKARLSRIAAPAKPKGKALRKTGRYTVAFTASESGAMTSTLSATPRKVAGIAKAGDLVLAARLSPVKAGSRTSVRLTVPRKLRPLLRGGRKLRLELRFVDAGGNVTTARRTIRVR